jgi:hypothetical protein
VIGLQQTQWRVSALGNLPASGLKRGPGGSEPNPLADSSNLGSMGEPKMRIFS